jgi:hypothetical protein
MGNVIVRSFRSLALAGLLCGQLAAQNTQVPAGPSALPASLTNAQFWEIISQFSEPGGYFTSDNYTSNELMIGQVATELINRGRTGGAYLGVGPEQNFTYIAATKPEVVFIVDIRRQAVMQHLMYKAIFEMSGTRSEFISRLFSRPAQPASPEDSSIVELWRKYLPVPGDTALYNSNLAAIHRHLVNVRGLALSLEDSASIALVYNTFFRYGPTVAYGSRATVQAPPPPYSPAGANFVGLTSVTDTAGVARSFLASDENYNFVRGMHSRNLIIPVVGDFGGPQALRKVGDWLRERRAVLASYYVSNVEQYLFRPNNTWREFYTNVGLMPLDTFSVFIRSNSMRVNSARVLGLAQDLPAPAGSVARTAAAPPPPPSPPRVPAVPPPAAQPAPQQANLGSLTGTVRDSASGRALPSASVTLVGTAVGAITDSTGTYVIPNVTPGIYTVVMTRVGYARTTAADVRVPAGQPTTLNFNPTVQVLILSGVVTTSGSSGFTVQYVGGGAAATGVVLCPIVPFLAAHNAGMVNSYADASRCPR